MGAQLSKGHYRGGFPGEFQHGGGVGVERERKQVMEGKVVGEGVGRETPNPFVAPRVSSLQDLSSPRSLSS